MGAFRRPAPMCNLQGLEFEATYLGCSVRQLWTDQENRRQGHSSAGRSGEICSAEPHISKVSCIWIKLFRTWSLSKQFSPSEESLKKKTQVIVQQQWSSRWGEFDIWTPNYCLMSTEKWFWLSWGHRWTDPERAVFFVFTYICKMAVSSIFFFWNFQPNLFVCVFTCHSKASDRVFGVGGMIAALSDHKNLGLGRGIELGLLHIYVFSFCLWSNLIAYICICFLYQMKFFFNYCFLAVHKNAIRLEKNLLLSNLFQFSRTFALTQQNKGK